MIKNYLNKLLRQQATERHIAQHHRAAFAELGRGDIALDCGANIGVVTAILAQTGATVHAFEPHPIAFAKLSAQFGQAEQVHLHQQAVWVENTSLPLYHHIDSAGDPLRLSVASSLLANKNNITTNQTTTVSAIDIAQFILDLPREVALLKIDIEGAEYDVLHHLITTGAIHRVRRTVTETHHDKNPDFKTKAAELQTTIQKHGIESIDLNWK